MVFTTTEKPPVSATEQVEAVINLYEPEARLNRFGPSRNNQKSPSAQIASQQKEKMWEALLAWDPNYSGRDEL